MPVPALPRQQQGSVFLKPDVASTDLGSRSAELHTSASFETTLRSLEVNSKSSFRSGPFRSGFETLLGVPLFVKGQYLQCLVTFGPPCLETRSWLRAKSKLGGMASEASFRSRFAFYCISILDRVGINRVSRKPTGFRRGGTFSMTVHGRAVFGPFERRG